MREYPSAKVDEAYEKTATASGLAYVRRALEDSFKFGSTVSALGICGIRQRMERSFASSGTE